MKRDPLHLEPVSSEAERSRRRHFFKVLAVEVCIGVSIGVNAAYFRNGPVIAAGVVCLMLCNFYLLWSGTQLVALNWSARQKLRKNGYRVCPNCSYDLAASPEAGKCPECGFDYDPAILKQQWESAYKRMLEKVGR